MLFIFTYLAFPGLGLLFPPRWGHVALCTSTMSATAVPWEQVVALFLCLQGWVVSFSTFLDVVWFLHTLCNAGEEIDFNSVKCTKQPWDLWVSCWWGCSLGWVATLTVVESAEEQFGGVIGQWPQSTPTVALSSRLPQFLGDLAG
jgi:hypothetical protein